MSYRDDYAHVSADVYWTLPKIFLLLLVLMAGGTVLGIGACAFGLIGGAASNAAKVVQQEFYPEALLQKYSWFKDAAAALDKKAADLKVYDARLDAMRKDYDGIPRVKWPRDDREQFSIWSSESAGIRASYNDLAAEYNANMAKFQYRFTNTGDVPQGGQPLPREYRPYLER